MNYQNYKERLFASLLSDNYHENFMGLINNLHEQGIKKKEIYNLFLAFFSDIQLDSRTKDDDRLYDRLADFMDGFYYDKGFLILPDESME